MTDAEIKQGIIERESQAFRLMLNALRCGTDAGLSTVADVLKMAQDQKKATDRWINDNLEDEDDD